jgi:hypothetical protein
MKPILPTLLCLPLIFVACGGEPKSTTPTGGTPAQKPMDNGHGEEKPLGDLTIGAHTFAVIQSGTIEAGKEGNLDLVFPVGKPVPGTVRAWIGVESGQGSMKAKLGKEGDRAVHGHVMVPKPIPDGSKIWIEIEENGATARGSIAWKP